MTVPINKAQLAETRARAPTQACAGGRSEELRQAAAAERLRHEAEAAGLRAEVAALRRLMEDAVPRAVYDEQVLKEGGGKTRLLWGRG